MAAAGTHRRHDTYTASHSAAVAQLAADLGIALGLADEQVWLLRQVGLVHDIGKIEVPRKIIEKPARLTPYEFGEVKRHVTAGYDILKIIPTQWPIADIAVQHHERLDGSGYPRGLKGSGILLEAQILAVADIAASMMSRASYRPSIPKNIVLDHIVSLRGKQLNAEAVDACVALFDVKGYELSAD